MSSTGAIRWLSRVVLIGLLIGSLVLAVVNLTDLMQSPAGAAFTSRSTAEVAAATERALARHATADVLAARLDTLLSETPRNWLAIEAVERLAADRGVPLPATLVARRDAAWDDDHGFMQSTANCARCAWDASTCSLSGLLLCRAPVDLSPVGDVAGLTRGSLAYLAGREVDQVDLILSAIGLGSVGLVLVSGGSSLTIKAGAGFAKLAKSMHRLPEGLSRPLMRAFKDGIDWSAVPRLRKPDDLSDLMRPAVIRPATAILDDTGRLVGNTSVLDGLHLMKYADDPADLAGIARVSDAVGPRTVGVVETLGKSRVLRLTMRLADEVWLAIAGLFGMMSALTTMLGSALGSRLVRRLRRLTKEPATR